MISVLITNYNKENFLRKNLSLLRSSSFKKFEVILYDDVSTDNSIKIIKEFKNIKTIYNKKKKFKSSELNQINGIIKCFYKSKGNIICLLDADDFFLKEKLLKINNYFQIYKNKRSVFDFPSISKNFKFKQKTNKNNWPSIFPTSCISIKRDIFKKFINKYIYKNKFPNLEIDARFTLYSYFVMNEYNLLKKKLTIYNDDPKGIMSSKKKFSIKWWLRRGEAHIYLDEILKISNKKRNFSIDKFITLPIYYLIKIFN